MSREEREKTNAIESVALLKAYLADLEWVSRIIASELRARIEARPLQTIKLEAAFGQFIRLDAWMRTLCKLDDPIHFQATSSGSRSILELVVDLVLLNSDQTAAQKLLDWEWSAKHKHACAVKAFYDGKGIEVPANNAEAVAFAVRDAEKIKAIRQKHGWIDGKRKAFHPPRWTKRNLEADCLEADKWPYRGSFSFSEFYATRFRTLCWAVHGSAFVDRTIRRDIFPFVSAKAILDASDLAVFGAMVALQTFDLLTAEMREKFESFNAERHRRRNKVFLEARLSE